MCAYLCNTYAYLFVYVYAVQACNKEIMCACVFMLLRMVTFTTEEF